MTKKNEKRLCWSCEGSVSHHLSQCPYCGVDVTKPREESSVFKGYGSPFQSPPQAEIPQPPYARAPKEATTSPAAKREVLALLLLLPGIVFFLFGLALVFFSSDGILSLQWNQNVAYFYFLGAVPLVFLGYRALR